MTGAPLAAIASTSLAVMASSGFAVPSPATETPGRSSKVTATRRCGAGAGVAAGDGARPGTAAKAAARIVASPPSLTASSRFQRRVVDVDGLRVFVKLVFQR